MPNVPLSTSSLRRHRDLLLGLWLALAVSYLFSVLPFGSATSGYMAPLPGPKAVSLDGMLAMPGADPTFSTGLSWDGDCQVIWATIEDAPPQLERLAAAPSLSPSASRLRHQVRPSSLERAPPARSRSAFLLRAPPRLA